MGLTLKPSKCKSLSIVCGSFKPITFKLGDTDIESINESSHKYLGALITKFGKPSEVFSATHAILKQRLENIDHTLVRDEYKFAIYVRYLLPSLRYHLTVHEINGSDLPKLDALCNSFLKKWLKIPRSGTLAGLYASGSLEIRNISQLYKECHVSAFVHLKRSVDSRVKDALASKLDREENL